MTSDVLLVAALGLLGAFLTGMILGYAVRSYISRRRRRRRSQRYDLSTALSPPPSADAAEDVVPLAPVLDGGLTSEPRGGPSSGSRRKPKQPHRN